MKLIITKTYEELSEITAQIFLGKMYEDRRVNMSITGGASPKGAYEIITKEMRKNQKNFTNVHFYNFDEIETPVTKRYMTMDGLKKEFLEPAGIHPDNIHPLTLKNMKEIQAELHNTGHLDFMLLGMGADGHFCGNLPVNCEFDKEIYPFQLNEKVPTYQIYMDAFGDPEDIATEYVTMGAAAVMKVKHLVMIVNGKKKALAVKKLLSQEVGTDFPSTVLRMHPNFTLIIDEEAASELDGHY